MPQINQLLQTSPSQNLMQARSQQILQQAANAQNTGDKSKIAAAAQQFESILLQKWLEDAEHSFAKVPGDDTDSNADPGADQFRSMAMQSLAEKMTASGGIGIAKMIIKQLGTKGDPSQPADSKDNTKGVLPPRNGIKVPSGKDR